MTHPYQDPVLAKLEEISAKQERTIQMQEEMKRRMDDIHRDCRRTSAVTGAVSGGITAVTIQFLRAKFGI